ncbi:Histidine kinase-, DNA gyrase B-, and HSP90-like ATPase [Catalinimonas alkaloidigena]|uniref:histidine kinase n=1 Tax=Catalinimonas alkaloidigena TaxID=1075417 RepID=A0A1G9P0U3_9BACT|nr:response regulator [Catalinimonas alkaloidigena]SDL92476.1 Histidine kinase-, DNA gyrase B-, and HSP90-like ATPase [Catalinimonas alkaloidigena]
MSLEESPDIKILLVDDREDNLLSLETLLERDGYQFKKAQSGREALKILLKEWDFTLILMDVQMPDINGFETAAMIHARDKSCHIPIIFITAHHNDENITKGYLHGAIDYIYKPINPVILRAKVSVFVDLYQKNYQLREQEKRLKAINLELEERVQERTAELLLKNQELEKINRDLDNFVYAASHDLKAPIANIDGLLQLLRKTLKNRLNEKEDQLFALANQSISKFSSTLNDLGEVIKVQRLDGEAIRLVSLPDVVSDVKQDLTSLIAETGATFEEDYEVKEMTFARKNLRSIFYNLMVNALKYRSPARPPHVRIRTYRGKGQVVFQVQDNGLGLSRSQQTKLFTLFKRMHTHVEGSGVGLSIVKRIIDNNGGTIEVESEVDRGTTFIVRLRSVEEALPTVS